MPSIYDVAREAGVSIGTVSYVLNDSGRVSPETAERVRRAAAALNYRPKAAAQALARGCNFTITLVSPLDIYAHQASLISVLQGIGEVLAETDYRLFVHPTLHRSNAWMELEAAVRSRQMDGVILMHVLPGDQRVALLRDAQIPFVLIGRSEDNRGLYYVDADVAATVNLAVDYLHRLGHHRVAMLSERGEARITTQLIECFNHAVESNGLDENCAVSVEVGSTPEDAYQGAINLFSNPERPTAVFAVSDLTVMAAYKAARNLALHIPKDLAILGYADSPLYLNLDPACSAVFSGAVDLGRISARMLLAQLSEKESSPSQVLVPPNLVIRASTE